MGNECSSSGGGGGSSGGTSSNEGNNNNYYSGFANEKCSVSDIMKATTANNALFDSSGPRHQLNAAVLQNTTDIKWTCVSEHITGPYKEITDKK